ncbi:MAG: SDR family oxidoreductase [Planctomycetota bacterium]
MLSIDLRNNIALVIGGSRGIGASVSKCLSTAGAAVVFTHTGNPKYRQRVETLVKKLEEQGNFIKAEALDARDSAKTTLLVERIIKEHGRIDVLVCNAGQNLARPAEDVTDQQWKEVIEINLSTAFYAVRAVLPYMMKAGYGRIILIGSSAVYDGGGGAIDYAAAKAGLSGMMMYLNKQYAAKGILTNVVHPCVIETDLLKERYSDENKRKQLIAQVPAGRLGKAEDIGGLVAYLASAWGDFICGQDILVDGGRTFFGEKS